MGSQETEFSESVMAVVSFFWMRDGESVIRMRERGEGSDFDIFFTGLVRDIILFAGAG